jgi:3-isopropylmalate/(R)-2-methylmalate dehydratase small subunit
MRLKMRGRSFVVGDWVHEREILGDDLGDVPRVSQLMPARTGLLRRLGVVDEDRFEGGDLIVAGRGFGTGTMRDQAPLLLKMRGVAAVLCQSVDPRFRQSAIRMGLPVLVLPGLKGGVADGDELIIDMQNGTIENLRTRRVLIAPTPSPRELSLLADSPGLDLLGISETMEPDPDVLEVPARPPSGDAA